MKKLATSVVLTALLGACASTPAPQPAPVQTKPAASTQATQPAAQASAADSAKLNANALPPYLDPANPLSQKRSVYFEFDHYNVADQYRAIVDNHAKYLNDNRNIKVKVEGNADERGSREYNLALGQKRAEAVKKLMTVNGVGESQIETISWGKEKPRAEGHDEAAWAENRRADIAYPGDKK
ncbi:peptidoglycan-associated lipoprotein Pal [Chitinivorax sp. PXF-14]|uniref:peptidoglycan-associated lipoprotein Pal n=1 Tax=Chitinivorax sp. PXF-14 TaxID=3230488 RepID=UPI0034668D2A